MFIGHYGPAFGAKAALRTIPLWVLFIAVQWLDVCWSILVLLGVEKVRITPGFTQGSPLDLYFMPYTHGLIGALILSAVYGAIVALFMQERKAYAFLIAAAAVFSHWILDFVVHVQDLPLWDNSMKVGLGLWRWVWISLPLELLTLFAGAWLYVKFVPARRGGNIWLWGFVVAMAAVEFYGKFGPPPTSPSAEAETALTAYLVLAALAAFVDLTRAKREIAHP
ncbi:MAG: hypothetical protein HY243_16795 [Proteobacteria bacterium]|nr:hypothetical protein [Pseudomonadota bacterium]